MVPRHRSTLAIGRLILALAIALIGVMAAGPTVGPRAQASIYTPRTLPSVTVAPSDLVGCRNCTTAVQPDNHEWDGPGRGLGVAGDPILPPPAAAATLANYHWKPQPVGGAGSQWHAVHLQGSASLVRSQKACPKVAHATASSITMQQHLALGCYPGYQGYAIGEVKFAGIGGTVNGYFKFGGMYEGGGGNFTVTTGNFSVPSQQCVMVCYFSAQYRPGAQYMVMWVEFWADHTGNLTLAQCEQ